MRSLVSLLDQPDTDMAMKVAVIEGAARLDLKDASPAIMTRLRTDSASSVRIAALRALQTLGALELDDAVRLALAGSDGALRMAAIGTIAASPLPDADKAAHLGTVIATGSAGEQQAALAGLATIKAPAAEALLGGLLQQVSAGTVAPEVTLDVFEAARANGAPALADRLDAMRVGRTLEHLGAVFPNAFLRGGDARRGFDVAANNPAAQCGRCHTIGDSTATVGPNLTHIGSQLSREQLLQALLDPGARIAPGFGAVSVTLKNGRAVAGLLREENARQLVIEDASGARRTVDVADIASRANAPSAMPPMGAVLTPHEIRDLVEMLATFQ
jgi:putative heme-binding domain-containing protein